MNIVRDHELQFFGRRRLVCVLALLILGLSISVSKATSPLPTAASMPAAERAKLERQLTESVQERVNSQKRIEGQSKRVVAKVRLDTSSKLVVVELSRGYVPKYASGVEDLEGELRTVVEELLMGLVDFSGVTFRYDGRSIQDFHPDPPKPSASRLTPKSATDLVALSPGHGYYFHYGFNDWRPQRDPGVGGLLEDTITPLYAYELQGALGARSSANSSFMRSFSGGLHAPSGRPWWELSTRYFLQDLYPGLPQIWNSMPNSTDPQRERLEDINSRPYYANHIGATAYLSIHTNGDPSPTPRGMRVYHQENRHDGAALGSSVLCYMKEVVQGQPAYKNFPVANNLFSGNYGELRLANAPGVIVEVAFHSNPEDAVALQDPVFRLASMRGVEKGYRMHRDNVGCEPFKLTSIPNVSGVYGGDLNVLFHYVGHPNFPLVLDTVNIECPSGWACSNKWWSYNVHKPSPLSFNFRCGTSTTQPSATFKWRTTLRDADGIVTAAIEHTTTCSR